MQNDVSNVLVNVGHEFCREFVRDPYLCYTEHGVHGYFWNKLYEALPAEQRYTTYRDQRVCVIQKEYPTAADLDQSRRQNWDISIIKCPPQSLRDNDEAYDYLRLATVAEFGMNEPKDHLSRDIARLTHDDANVDDKVVIHLYRLSQPGAKVSRRDWSRRHRRIVSLEGAATVVNGTDIALFYAVVDQTNPAVNGAWFIQNGNVEPIQ